MGYGPGLGSGDPNFPHFTTDYQILSAQLK